MSKQRNKLERRRDAAQATLDRFNSRPFDLAKKNDCAHLALFCLKQLGIKIPVAKVGAYKTALGAQAALKRAFGVSTLAEVADKFFERIAPAMALPADLIEVRGSGGAVGALGVYLGNNIIVVYHDDAPDGAVAGNIVYDQGDVPLAAWRTLPL